MLCQLSNIDIYYEFIGSGHPVILLHGFGPDHRAMTGCMEPVFQRHPGWKRYYPDLPGMGRTPGRDWITNSDHMLQVVLDFIDALIPGQTFTLAGFSYGGYLARGVVHHRPDLVDGLFLLCPGIIPDQGKRTLPLLTALDRDVDFLSSLESEERENFESFAVVLTQATYERTRDEVGVGFAIADEEFLTKLQEGGYGFTFEIESDTGPFTKPTLILVGRQDHIVGYQDAWGILESYPRATYAVLDRAGHNLQIEQETLFNTLVGEWLERVSASFHPSANYL